MTTTIASEGAATALPVTGSGPFSLVVAVIGVVATIVGSLLRHVAAWRA